jgi:hypothetical protein
VLPLTELTVPDVAHRGPQWPSLGSSLARIPGVVDPTTTVEASRALGSAG